MALKGSVFSVTQKQSVKVCPGKLQPSQYAPEHTCQNQKEKHCFVPLPSVQLFQPGGQKSVRLVTHMLRGPRTLTKRGIEQDPTEGELLGKQLLTKISYRIYHLAFPLGCSVEGCFGEDVSRCYTKNWICGPFSLAAPLQ